MTKKELEAAQKSIQSFCDKFEAVMTLTNDKGMWTARVTKKRVQVFLVTGESIFDCMSNLSSKMEEKRKKLGA